jgi:dipeptide/tripeptide permease
MTAWFTPELRDQMMSIVIGSTFRGLLTGVAAGWVAKRFNSMLIAVLVGFGVGLVLSYLNRWLAKPTMSPSTAPGSTICR